MEEKTVCECEVRKVKHWSYHKHPHPHHAFDALSWKFWQLHQPFARNRTGAKQSQPYLRWVQTKSKQMLVWFYHWLKISIKPKLKSLVISDKIATPSESIVIIIRVLKTPSEMKFLEQYIQQETLYATNMVKIYCTNKILKHPIVKGLSLSLTLIWFSSPSIERRKE